MNMNKSQWQQWIDVDKYLNSNFHIKHDDKMMKSLSMEEILDDSHIRKQLIFGYVANWPSVRDSMIATFMQFEKDSENAIDIFLFGKPVVAWSDDELKFLLMDLYRNNLSGVKLIHAATSGELASIRKIIESADFTSAFDYLSPALRMAAKNGHADCVEMILSDQQVDTTSDCYLLALKDAVVAGHKSCVECMISTMDASTREKALVILLLDKYQKSQVAIYFIRTI